MIHYAARGRWRFCGKKFRQHFQPDKFDVYCKKITISPGKDLTCSLTQEELIGLLTLRCQEPGFLQVSPPLTYGSEGPFIITLAQAENRYCCIAFEILNADRFLSDPGAETRSYYDQAFFELVARYIDFSLLRDASEYHTLVRRKLIPDEPACRTAAHSLWQTDPDAAACLLMVRPDGTWISGEEVRTLPAWLA